jgi:hypothetical protein
MDDWHKMCPPAQQNHWKMGRSAMLLADHWINTNGNDVIHTLSQNSNFSNTIIDICSPEYETRIDTYGAGRTHDLLAIGRNDQDSVLISIEAKVDESFGNETIGNYYGKSVLKRLAGINTKVPERIENLIAAIFKDPDQPFILELQYQLLHAIAGTLAEAKIRKINKAIFLVHTFRTTDINDKKYEVNQIELDKLIYLLSDKKCKQINNGVIYGPYHVNGNQFIPDDVELFIGKVTS